MRRDTLIVIPASGNADYTALAVESVRRNTSGAMVVIVETDSSVVWEEAEDLAVLRLGAFESFSDSVNRGIEFGLAKLDFEYIVLLNNDTVPAKGWLPPLQQALDDGFCVAGPVTNSCGHGEQVVHPAFSCTEPSEVNHEAMDRFADSLEPSRSPVFAVVGMCMAFRSDLLGSIGMLDRRFRVGNFEDNDWCLRASEAVDKGCCVCRDSFVWHFGSATFRESGSFADAMESNRVRFERKWLGRADIPKRHNNSIYRTPRVPISLSPMPGDPDATSAIERVASEMRARGLAVGDGPDIPLDTRAVPEADSDCFYEFCDSVERAAVEAAFERSVSGRPDISVCMIVKDEEAVLDRCLKSVASLAKQLVVVDTGSTDATVAIAKRNGAEVYHYAADGPFNFSAARNLSLSKARCGWVLVVDADECLLPADVSAIKSTVVSGKKAAYMISTRLYQDNPKIEGIVPNDGMHPDTTGYCGYVLSTKVRLWPRESGLEFRNEVHETVEQSAVEAGIDFGQCEAIVHHFGGRSLSEKDGLYAELGYEKARNDPCYRTYRELGLQLYRMGKFDEAVAAMRKAIEFQPGDVECTVLLGASLSASGDKGAAKQAEEAYLSALKSDRDSELANRYYATFLNQQGRYKEAHWHYRKVFDRARQAGDVKTLCDFAYVCQNLGQPDEAIELLEAALRVNRQYVRSTGMLECAYHMSGVMAGRSGDMPRASSQFRKALEINPNFAEAKHNLQIAERWAAADRPDPAL